MFFDKGNYSEHNTVSISELFSHIPRDVLSANFGCDESEFDVIPEKEVYIGILMQMNFNIIFKEKLE